MVSHRRHPSAQLAIGLSSALQAHAFFTSNLHLLTLGKSWFWAEHRVESLDLHTLNGMDAARYHRSRTQKRWRREIMAMDWTARGDDLSALTGQEGLGKGWLELGGREWHGDKCDWDFGRGERGGVGSLGMRMERNHKHERSKNLQEFQEELDSCPTASEVTGSPQRSGQLKLEADVMQPCLRQLLVFSASLLVNSAGMVRRIFYQTTLL